MLEILVRRLTDLTSFCILLSLAEEMRACYWGKFVPVIVDHDGSTRRSLIAEYNRYTAFPVFVVCECWVGIVQGSCLQSTVIVLLSEGHINKVLLELILSPQGLDGGPNSLYAFVG